MTGIIKNIFYSDLIKKNRRLFQNYNSLRTQYVYNLNREKASMALLREKRKYLMEFEFSRSAVMPKWETARDNCGLKIKSRSE